MMVRITISGQSAPWPRNKEGGARIKWGKSTIINKHFEYGGHNTPISS
jgi:hypothetical protein